MRIAAGPCAALAFSLALSLVAVPARAADAVTDAMQAAYAPYRAALFRTNSKAQVESEQAIARAQAEWNALVERFASRPPAPYDRDPAVAGALNAVADVYRKAEAEIRDKRLADAHETLEEARDLMAELRRRNGVVVYSDHMNAYHAEMEHVLKDGPKLVDAPQGMMQLMARVGALDYLAQRLRSEAPPALAGEARFAASVKGVEESVAALRTAVLNQDAAGVRAALGKLKGPYSKLFLEFG